MCSCKRLIVFLRAVLVTPFLDLTRMAEGLLKRDLVHVPLCQVWRGELLDEQAAGLIKRISIHHIIILFYFFFFQSFFNLLSVLLLGLLFLPSQGRLGRFLLF